MGKKKEHPIGLSYKRLAFSHFHLCRCYPLYRFHHFYTQKKRTLIGFAFKKIGVRFSAPFGRYRNIHWMFLHILFTNKRSTNIIYKKSEPLSDSLLKRLAFLFSAPFGRYRNIHWMFLHILFTNKRSTNIIYKKSEPLSDSLLKRLAFLFSAPFGRYRNIHWMLLHILFTNKRSVIGAGGIGHKKRASEWMLL